MQRSARRALGAALLLVLSATLSAQAPGRFTSATSFAPCVRHLPIVASPIPSCFPSAAPPRPVPSLYDWSAWWFFNQDRFFDRVRIPVERPTPEQRDRIHAALLLALDDASPDTRAVAAVAVGKMQRSEDIEILKAAAADSHIAVRESACIALGLLGNRSAEPFLTGVLGDTPAARRAFARNGRPLFPSTRAFAALGLGLLFADAGDQTPPGTVTALQRLFESSSGQSLDLQLAPVVALGVIRAPSAVPFLKDLVAGRASPAWVRGHAVWALARIEGVAAQEFLLPYLRDKQFAVRQSVALALGRIVRPEDDKAVKALRKLAWRGSGLAARNFARLALGRIGGEGNDDILLRDLDRARRFERTFGALALAVGFADEGAAVRSRIEAEAKERITAAFRGAKRPHTLGACAVALGILADAGAAPIVRKTLRRHLSAPWTGPLCLALGLLGDRDALPDVRSVLRWNPDVDARRQAALALGLIGGPEVLLDLAGELQDPTNGPAVQGAVARAFARIGGVLATEHLLALLTPAPSSTSTTRAAIVAAAGLLVDQQSPPRLRSVREDFNYLLRSDVLGRFLALL